MVLDERPDAFDGGLLEDLVVWENLIEAMLQNIKTTEELRQAVDYNRKQVERMATIQRALLPAAPTDVPGLEIDVSYETFDHAGGDMYSIQKLGSDARGEGVEDQLWSILVGDVSGHGPAAAVVMAIVDSLLGSCPREIRGPARVLGYLNEKLCEKRIEGSFVTAVMGVFDARTRRFTYGCAGHPPVLWQRPLGEDRVLVKRLDGVGGIPLGVLRDATYEEETVDLSIGDTLVLYTDGITESRAPDGTFFGVEGLQGAMQDCKGDVFCVVESVMRILKKHESGGRPQDDQTLLALQVVD